jgi:F0F1-type ATP synthase delta subunit
LKPPTIARNYAEALFAAAEASDGVAPYGELIDAVAGAIATDARIAIVLESPRVAKTVKSRLLADALEGHAPREFVRFLQAVVRRGRQGLFGEIAREYQGLLDRKLNRVHAGVTLTRDPDGKLRDEIVRRLTASLGGSPRHFRPTPRSWGRGGAVGDRSTTDRCGGGCNPAPPDATGA